MKTARSPGVVHKLPAAWKGKFARPGGLNVMLRYAIQELLERNSGHGITKGNVCRHGIIRSTVGEPILDPGGVAQQTAQRALFRSGVFIPRHAPGYEAVIHVFVQVQKALLHQGEDSCC